jgi:hypothetical protein
MPSMLPYGLVAVLCAVGALACLIYGLCSAAKEGDEFVDQLLCEHREECERQSDAALDDLFVAVDDAKTETLCEELESIFALEAREPVR